jgi:hypothetical protein
VWYCVAPKERELAVTMVTIKDWLVQLRIDLSTTLAVEMIAPRYPVASHSRSGIFPSLQYRLELLCEL